MHAALAVRRTLLFLAAAILSAVCSDWLIEGVSSLGVYGRTYAEHDQRSVVCTLTAGSIFLVAAALTTLFERLRVLRQDRIGSDWLAEAAHDISTRWSWRALPPTFIVALAVRYAMESARLLQSDGHIASGFDWLGGPVVFALIVHAALCAAALFGLFVFMNTVDRTLEGVFRLVVALIASCQLYAPPKSRFIVCGAHRVLQYVSLLARNLGERAPPAGAAAALR